MIKMLFVVLAFAGCAGLQQAKEVAESSQATDVLDAREAICKLASRLNPADPEVAQVQNLCAADATLKEIAAKYAGDACEKSEPAHSTSPAVGSIALPPASSGL